METTPDECIQSLRDAAEMLEKSPTKQEYEDLGLTPASATILRVMGGWNAAKERAGLETNYSRGSRVEPKPDDVEIPEGTVWEDMSQDQRWHYRNVEWNRERTLDRRQQLRAWTYELKRESDGCSLCDESDPACLDFHHLDGTDKEMSVGNMVTYGYSKEKLLEEIDKCELLCANCHRKEHYQLPEGVDTP